MKRSLWFAVLMIAITSAAFAEQAPTPSTPVASQDQKIRSGTKKIVLGAALIGAGGLMMPITSFDTAPSTVGRLMVVSGMGLVLWGSHQRYKAANPSVTIGIAVGRTKGIAVTRSW